MPSHSDAECHEDKVYHAEGNEILPFEGKNLVNTQTREGPTQPHQQKDYKEGLAKEPNRSRNEVHHTVESVETINVQGSPATEEDGRSHTGTDEEVQVLCQVVVTEVHT